MATKRIRLPGPPPTEGSGSTPLTIEFLVEQPFLLGFVLLTVLLHLGLSPVQVQGSGLEFLPAFILASGLLLELTGTRIQGLLILFDGLPVLPHRIFERFQLFFPALDLLFEALEPVSPGGKLFSSGVLLCLLGSHGSFGLLDASLICIEALFLFQK